MASSDLSAEAVATRLGWVALLRSDKGTGRLERVSVGHPSGPAALRAMMADTCEAVQVARSTSQLARSIQRYADGEIVQFDEVSINLSHLTSFQRRVIKHCRAIGYGETKSYSELAGLAGSPAAARAVGNTMAANRYALIVPCHRVIAQGGRLGGYSARQGVSLKRRLLEMEAAAMCADATR